MLIEIFLIVITFSTTSLTITEPVDGETYDGDWLTVRAIVENENEIPENVRYTLNAQSAIDGRTGRQHRDASSAVRRFSERI